MSSSYTVLKILLRIEKPKSDVYKVYKDGHNVLIVKTGTKSCP